MRSKNLTYSTAGQLPPMRSLAASAWPAYLGPPCNVLSCQLLLPSTICVLLLLCWVQGHALDLLALSCHVLINLELQQWAHMDTHSSSTTTIQLLCGWFSMCV
jgi:hypothetical protein